MISRVRASFWNDWIANATKSVTLWASRQNGLLMPWLIVAYTLCTMLADHPDTDSGFTRSIAEVCNFPKVAYLSNFLKRWVESFQLIQKMSWIKHRNVPQAFGWGVGAGGYMPVQTVALQSKQIFCCRIMFCMCRMVLFTAFYALLSPNSLFWVILMLYTSTYLSENKSVYFNAFLFEYPTTKTCYSFTCL